MKYGRSEIDPVLLWSRWVEFPSDLDPSAEFASLAFCPNPSHDNSRSPAFQVNLREPLVHCFSRCGISGSYQHAVALCEGLYEKFNVEGATTQREKRRRTDRAHREASRIILRTSRTGGKFHRVQRKAARSPRSDAAIQPDALQYERFLPAAAQEYLDGRGISPHSVSLWQIGWLPEEKRVAIPALDVRGKTRFLIKRAIDGRRPPYLYTEGFPKTSLLFGAGLIDPRLVKSEGVIIVEGSLDAIRLHQHGLRNAVAILGTGISDEQRNILASLRPKKVYLFFDRDMAGVRNIEIAFKALHRYPLYVVKFPKGRTDPAELTAREAHRQLERAENIFSFRRSM